MIRDVPVYQVLLQAAERWPDRLALTSGEQSFTFAQLLGEVLRACDRLKGIGIGQGDKVVLWWQAANFDERVFTDPYEFDIRRDPNPHLSFGVGSHFCLGANLARLEIKLVFEGLLQRAARVERTGLFERTRSNKHAGFRHAPVHIEKASS